MNIQRDSRTERDYLQPSSCSASDGNHICEKGHDVLYGAGAYFLPQFLFEFTLEPIRSRFMALVKLKGLPLFSLRLPLGVEVSRGAPFILIPFSTW